MGGRNCRWARLALPTVRVHGSAEQQEKEGGRVPEGGSRPPHPSLYLHQPPLPQLTWVELSGAPGGTLLPPPSGQVKPWGGCLSAGHGSFFFLLTGGGQGTKTPPASPLSSLPALPCQSLVQLVRCCNHLCPHQTEGADGPGQLVGAGALQLGSEKDPRPGREGALGRPQAARLPCAGREEQAGFRWGCLPSGHPRPVQGRAVEAAGGPGTWSCGGGLRGLVPRDAEEEERFPPPRGHILLVGSPQGSGSQNQGPGERQAGPGECREWP